MNDARSTTAAGRPAGRCAARLAAALITASILAACGGTLPSPPPTISPAPSTVPTPAVDPSPTVSQPPSTPVADPTTAPPGRPAEWIDAGALGLEPYDLKAVSLADGGAIAIGQAWIDDVTQPAAYRWSPGATSWEAIEPLNKPRTEFGLTRLLDGRLLVAGGLNDQMQSFSSAYTYDPERASDGWLKVGLLDSARTAPSIATLLDGRVLVAGGYYRTPAVETVSLCDRLLGSAPGRSPWETTPTRRGNDDVDVPPYGYPLASAELFDPKTGQWTMTGNLNFARAGAPAVTLADGRILIVGMGQDVLTDVASESYDTAEIFDPVSETFAVVDLPGIDEPVLRNLGVDLRGHFLEPGNPGRLAGLPDGGALLVGRHHWAKHDSDVVESLRFDPANGSWMATGVPCASVGFNEEDGGQQTPGPCLFGGFVAPLGDGLTLSAGPLPSAEFEAEPRSAAIYEPPSDSWAEQPGLPGDYMPGLAVGLTDGTALIVAGKGDADGSVGLQFIPPQ